MVSMDQSVFTSCHEKGEGIRAFSIQTTNKQHAMRELEVRFTKLSASRRASLVREAKGFVFRFPGSADNSNFWRPRGWEGEVGLSARQVIQLGRR